MHHINYRKSCIDLSIGEKAKVSKDIQANLGLPTQYITTTAGGSCSGCVFAADDLDCEVALPLLCCASQRKDKVSVIFASVPTP